MNTPIFDRVDGLAGDPDRSASSAWVKPELARFLQIRLASRSGIAVRAPLEIAEANKGGAKRRATG